jgi:hypothetical protein
MPAKEGPYPLPTLRARRVTGRGRSGFLAVSYSTSCQVGPLSSPNWKLENGAQRPAPETRPSRTEMPKIASQRLGHASSPQKGRLLARLPAASAAQRDRYTRSNSLRKQSRIQAPSLSRRSRYSVMAIVVHGDTWSMSRLLPIVRNCLVVVMRGLKRSSRSWCGQFGRRACPQRFNASAKLGRA